MTRKDGTGASSRRSPIGEKFGIYYPTGEKEAMWVIIAIPFFSIAVFMKGTPGLKDIVLGLLPYFVVLLIAAIGVLLFVYTRKAWFGLDKITLANQLGSKKMAFEKSIRYAEIELITFRFMLNASARIQLIAKTDNHKVTLWPGPLLEERRMWRTMLQNVDRRKFDTAATDRASLLEEMQLDGVNPMGVRGLRNFLYSYSGRRRKNN